MQDAVRAVLVNSSFLIRATLVSFASCRDNLEFLQWIKRFWDSNYGGQGYDAVARRRGAPTDPPATIAPLASARTTAGLGASSSRSGGRTPIVGHRAPSTTPSKVLELESQLKEMTATLEGLEKERDFYFSKVRLYLLPAYLQRAQCPFSSAKLRSSSKPEWTSQRQKA